MLKPRTSRWTRASSGHGIRLQFMWNDHVFAFRPAHRQPRDASTIKTSLSWERGRAYNTTYKSQMYLIFDRQNSIGITDAYREHVFPQNVTCLKYTVLVTTIVGRSGAHPDAHPDAQSAYTTTAKHRNRPPPTCKRKVLFLGGRPAQRGITTKHNSHERGAPRCVGEGKRRGVGVGFTAKQFVTCVHTCLRACILPADRHEYYVYDEPSRLQLGLWW